MQRTLSSPDVGKTWSARRNSQNHCMYAYPYMQAIGGNLKWKKVLFAWMPTFFLWNQIWCSSHVECFHVFGIFVLTLFSLGNSKVSGREHWFWDSFKGDCPLVHFLAMLTKVIHVTHPWIQRFFFVVVQPGNLVYCCWAKGAAKRTSWLFHRELVIFFFLAWNFVQCPSLFLQLNALWNVRAVKLSQCMIKLSY